jgi:hypothetical protein
LGNLKILKAGLYYLKKLEIVIFAISRILFVEKLLIEERLNIVKVKL